MSNYRGNLYRKAYRSIDIFANSVSGIGYDTTADWIGIAERIIFHRRKWHEYGKAIEVTHHCATATKNLARNILENSIYSSIVVRYEL